MKDIAALKQHATAVSRTQKDINRLNPEIKKLEEDLEVTGSTKTADDVQLQLDELSSDLCALFYIFNSP